jgi:preprotein translocase subunit SecE
MAKSTTEKPSGTTSKAPATSKAPVATAKAPAKSGGIKNPFSRSSSSATTKQSTGPRGTVSTKPHGRVRTFLREVRIEMSKVTWPPRKEIITSTGVVIVAVIIAAVYIGVFDFIWSTIVQLVGLG